ncbi:hypothetical protein [Natrinema altunense]|uniref:hypothetical protein n=1 Tax=Natrinema altunense TaxID=222984 RepID=UPI001A9321D5|nr:hypothetical protein [Natrinema altunense]
MSVVEFDDRDLVDVLRYETASGPSYRSVPAGEGTRIVAAHENELRKRIRVRRLGIAGIAIAVGVGGVLIEHAIVGALVAAILVGAGWLVEGDHEGFVPTVVDERIRLERAASTYDIDVHSADPYQE